MLKTCTVSIQTALRYSSPCCLSASLGDIDATGMIDFSADGKTLYLLDSRGRDKSAFFAMDMATREFTVLAAIASAIPAPKRGARFSPSARLSTISNAQPARS
jgi:hypothetical protein